MTPRGVFECRKAASMARDGRKRGTRQRERRSVGRRTAELESAWTEAGGLRVHARFSTQTPPEDAPPIILVHGLGVASRSMVPLAKALAPSYRVHAPDLPGFGDSEKPPQVLNLAELTDCLVAWTRACGLERAVFLGNSVVASWWCAWRFGIRISSSA